MSPAGAEAYRFAEMMICLPPDWKLGEADFQDEANFWPSLAQVAGPLPHQYDTWLWMGHTVPNGDPPEPFAPNTDLSAALLSHPVCFDDDVFAIVHAKDDTKIYFLALIPLYREEMEFKLSKGMNALGELLDLAGVTEILDISRPNVWDAIDG